MLQSAVFFDVGKDEIKEGGRAFLDEFIPVYLSVLLRPEYAQDLGEIIIEGHTDTQGTYLMNLELSQRRALSVATYCLGMKGLTPAQRERLRDILTAKGRSYSVPVLLQGSDKVDMDASRRVEFKFRLKDTEMIDEIRKILAQ
jgi:chemotaxis protein MotB